MKEFLKKNKIGLALSLYAIAVSAFFYFAVASEIGKIAEKAQQIAQRDIDRQINEERLSSLPDMEDGYARYEENKEKLSIILDTSGEVAFIEKLEALAEETGNKIEFRIQDNTSASNKKKKETGIKGDLAYSKYISIQIAIEGNYEDLVEFIQKLENFPNYVNIISLSSEKKEVNSASRDSDPFVTGGRRESSVSKTEVINTILDAVAYINSSE